MQLPTHGAPDEFSAIITHKGPHTGILAILYTVLFWIGLYPVTAMYKTPNWLGPWESASTIVDYFQNYGGRVLFCITFQLRR